ncbi:MAG: putative oxidoreductase [Naasia sp.]|jgi:glycolate oxidase|uniref:FAD-binding oxidoreductase n=1 Tax=Naasia sp. TaxID=2546198 RepID=UPI0026056C89|nr:FAD-linked oxidase C-terminal domain-containing protein [Naasia sp.]MCU1571339.1 putative oxidoreductase [Naasia sp.]
MTDQVIDKLRAVLGEALVLEPSRLDAVREDKSGFRSAAAPLAVVEARSAEDVAAVLRIATETRTPVVPRGAGTGLAGGAIGDAGSIVLSLRGMDRILEVDVADEVAVVEPGILNGDLNAALREQGLWWAPDPASKAISTVGGNIATNAGGILCAKYGVTREAVLALTVVLADGRTIEVGHRTVKGVTGYDLAALLIGSEGTLGVIVRATLKLRRLPTGDVATLGAYFPSVRAAAAASSAITAAGLRPAALELLDAASLAAIEAYLAGEAGTVPAATRGGAYLLVQTDGDGAGVEAAEALGILLEHGGDAELTTDPEEGERLLRIRRSAHPAFERLGRVLIEDVAVPRSRLVDMFDAVERIAARHGIAIPTIAHAGDGNLHPNLVLPPGGEQDGTVPDVVWLAAGELFEAALALGGTLTGEHGVGLLKRRWLERELGPDQYELQRRIKAAFDPLGILNPGKVFP